MTTELIDPYQNIIRYLKENDHFLITTHVRPDGDSIASVLIIAEILSYYRKTAWIILDDCIPGKLKFLHGIEKIQRFDEHHMETGHHSVLVLDSSDLQRTGRVVSLFKPGEPVVNMDHHPGNQRFGTLNLVNPAMSSTVELIYPLVHFSELSWTKELATLVYTGILSDTGRFLFANTSARTLFICAEMVKKGADPSEISEMLYNRNSPETMKAYAEALSSLEFYMKNQITCIQLLNHSGKRPDSVDTEGFVDTIAGIDGVKVSFFCFERQPGHFRVSFRSKGEVDVNEVAGRFGGGGHVRASGCNIQGSLADVKKRILEVLEEKIKQAE